MGDAKSLGGAHGMGDGVLLEKLVETEHGGSFVCKPGAIPLKKIQQLGGVRVAVSEVWMIPSRKKRTKCWLFVHCWSVTYAV